MIRQATGENDFQVRLNEMFTACDPRPSNAVVAKGLLTQGCQVSKTSISQLRNGVRRSPSDEVGAALLLTSASRPATSSPSLSPVIASSDTPQ